MKVIFVPLLVLFSMIIMSGCSSVTALRTKELKIVGDVVRKDVKNEINSQVDSLQRLIDSLSAAQDLVNRRLTAELSMLSKRVASESERNDSRQEEILYRLDLLLGKSDKILAKKVVINKSSAEPLALDSIEREAERLLEAESMFNTGRSDYLRGEYKLAFATFKQVYEQMKTGEFAEQSLYWMALCLVEVNQKEKAKILFSRFAEDFPTSSKICTVLFKLSNMAAEEKNIPSQKQYLQKLLEVKSCMESNEFLQGAEILEELLNAETK
jgi:TolA-binding protein